MTSGMNGGGRQAEETRRPIPIGDYFFALGGIVAGVVVAIGATSIRVPPGSTNAIGPRAFPYLVALMLVVSAVAVIIATLRGHGGQAEEGEDVDEHARTDWTTVGVLTILFLVFGLMIEPIGWPIAVTVLFSGSAWKLGASRWWMALIIGAIMGLLTQYLFGTLLGISLPAGPLLDWIPIF